MFMKITSILNPIAVIQQLSASFSVEKDRGEERGRQKQRTTVIFSLVLVWQDQFLFVIMGSGCEAVWRLSVRVHTFVWLIVLPPVWYERLKMLLCVCVGWVCVGCCICWNFGSGHSKSLPLHGEDSTFHPIVSLEVTVWMWQHNILSLSLSRFLFFSLSLLPSGYMDGSHIICQKHVWAML